VCACLVTAASSLSFAGVHIVDASGSADFTAIQPAIDASVDGDVIVIRTGTYGSFMIDDKALSVFADANAIVTVNGGVRVLNVATTKTVVVSGIQATGASPPFSLAENGISITNNHGALRFQNCSFTGGRGVPHSVYDYYPGAHGALLVDDWNLSFVGCTLKGGDGGGTYGNCWDCTGGAGGDGVHAQTSVVALYDSHCAGGEGGSAGHIAAPGGDGYRALDHGAFASRTTFSGGDGGDGTDGTAQTPGADGGNGFEVATGASVHLLSSVCLGGDAGHGYGPHNGAPGEGIVGSGFVDQLLGTARVLTSNVISTSGGLVSVTVFGQPGDRVYLPGSSSTFFGYNAALKGVWLIPHPTFLPLEPLGVIPASGTLTFDAPVGSSRVGGVASVEFLQGYIVDAQGAVVLASPIDVLRLY
jgi:hypothetical protein